MALLLKTSTPNVKTLNLPVHPFQEKITITPEGYLGVIVLEVIKSNAQVVLNVFQPDIYVMVTMTVETVLGPMNKVAVDTPPTGLVQENVFATLESVMVEMIVLTALMKDKIFVLHVIVMRNSEETVALEMVRIWLHFLEDWWMVIEDILDHPF